MLPKIIFLFTFLILFTQQSFCIFPYSPIVAIKLSQSGFHRDLLYSVHFENPLIGKYCEYALEQQFPAGVYVSVDQLNDLKRLQKLNAFYPEFVDIEASAEKSTPFAVILLGIPSIRDEIKLPIHYRYHAPSSENEFVDVELKPPLMYIKCRSRGEELIDTELLLTPFIKHCLTPDKRRFVTNSDESIEQRDNLDCNWHAMKVEFQVKTSLIASIPVGDTKALPAVLYITIILSWAISLWTVFRTRAVPRSINKKLEEQRIISNKNQ